jgi:hypothetical protein
VRTDDDFTCSDDVRLCLCLQLVCDEEQEKGGLQEVDSEEPGHEGEIWIVVENGIDGFGSTDGVVVCVEEGWGLDPVVCIIEKGDRIPFTIQEDVQGMHEVRAVRNDNLGVVNGFGIRKWEIMNQRVPEVMFMSDVWLGQIRGSRIMSLKYFQTATVRLEVLRNLGDTRAPFKRIEEQVSKDGMIPGLI